MPKKYMVYSSYCYYCTGKIFNNIDPTYCTIIPGRLLLRLTKAIITINKTINTKRKERKRLASTVTIITS